MRKLSIVLTLMLLLALVIAAVACDGAEVTPTVTPTPASTPTPIPTSTPTPVPTLTATPTTTPPPTASTAPLGPVIGSYNHVLLYNLSAAHHTTAINSLQEKGYTVHPLEGYEQLNEKVLAEYGTLIVRSSYLSINELPLLEDWVKAGGGALFLVETGLRIVTTTNYILLPLCGIVVNNDNVNDLVNKFLYGRQSGICTTAVAEHPTTQNISELAFSTLDWLPSLTITSHAAEVVVQGERNAYSIHYAQDPPLAAAAQCSAGRVVVVSGAQPFSTDMIALSDNQLFLINIIDWLAHRDSDQ